MEEILQSWLKAYTALGEYLLDADFLLLNPSYIYRDTQTGSYLFTWFPFQLTEEKKEFQTLAEYFLPKIDHGDKSAVALGYGIYKEAAGGTICPDVVKNFYTNRLLINRRSLCFLKMRTFLPMMIQRKILMKKNIRNCWMNFSVKKTKTLFPTGFSEDLSESSFCVAFCFSSGIFVFFHCSSWRF